MTTLPTADAYPEQPGYSFAYFPLVGLIVGALLMGVQWGAAQLLLPDVAALVVIVAWVGITGGLHLDGFGDACDGLP
ncbi:MAG: adenosylcobinamide-GDP ribazoletransferase [Chloroflexota bacterium]